MSGVISLTLSIFYDILFLGMKVRSYRGERQVKIFFCAIMIFGGMVVAGMLLITNVERGEVGLFDPPSTHIFNDP